MSNGENVEVAHGNEPVFSAQLPTSRLQGRASNAILVALVTAAFTVPAAFLLGFGMSQSEAWNDRIRGFQWDRFYQTSSSPFGESIGGFPVVFVVIIVALALLGQVLMLVFHRKERSRWGTALDDQSRFGFLAGTTSDAVLMFSVNGAICSWNRACVELTGVDAHSIVGRRVSCCVDVKDADGNELLFDNWSRENIALPKEIRIVDANGVSRWFDCTYKKLLHRGLSRLGVDLDVDMRVSQFGDRSRRTVNRIKKEVNREFPEELLVLIARDCTDEHELRQLRADVDRLAELESAQRSRVLQLQESLQPMMPVAPGTEFGVFYSPSDQSAPTGGDFYDWQVLPNGDLHVTVVDVLGNGIDATNDAFAVIHALRILAFQGTPVDRLIREANDLLMALDKDLVATTICVRYHPTTGRARIASGGHPPALLVRSRGDVREINAPGIPVGWPGAGSERAVEVTLEESDTLVLYTDGLVEAQRDIIEGINALSRAAAVTRFLPSSHLARALVETSLRGADRRDDSLALVLRRIAPKAIDLLPGFRHRGQPASRDVPIVRRRVQEWAMDHPPLAPIVNDLLIAITELLTNAIRYAVSYYELRVSFDDKSIVIEVEDDGPGFGVSALHPMTERRVEESGRGLLIVKSIADDMHIERVQGRCIVRVHKSVLPTEKSEMS